MRWEDERELARTLCYHMLEWMKMKRPDNPDIKKFGHAYVHSVSNVEFGRIQGMLTALLYLSPDWHKRLSRVWKTIFEKRVPPYTSDIPA